MSFVHCWQPASAHSQLKDIEPKMNMCKLATDIKAKRFTNLQIGWD
jgi:hypothetical protein